MKTELLKQLWGESPGKISSGSIKIGYIKIKIFQRAPLELLFKNEKNMAQMHDDVQQKSREGGD